MGAPPAKVPAACHLAGKSVPAGGKLLGGLVGESLTRGMEK